MMLAKAHTANKWLSGCSKSSLSKSKAHVVNYCALSEMRKGTSNSLSLLLGWLFMICPQPHVFSHTSHCAPSHSHCSHIRVLTVFLMYRGSSHCRTLAHATPSTLQGWEHLPWWRSGWESACQCRGYGFKPWSGKIPHAAERLGPWATITEPARLEPVLRNERPRQWEARALRWRVAPACRN